MARTMTFKIKLIAGLAAAFSILLLVADLSYTSFVRNSEDRRWVTHTHSVLEKLDSLQIDLIDAETGQRGYIITGEEAYLAPYQDGIGRISQEIRELRELTADNPVQQGSLDRMEPLIAAKLGELQNRIEIRKKEELAASVAAVAEGSGKQLMDQIRVLAAAMKQEEDRLLVLRSNELEASGRRTRMIIVIGEALGFLFLAEIGRAHV